MQFTQLSNRYHADRSRLLCHPRPLVCLTALALLAFFTLLLAACTGSSTPVAQTPSATHAPASSPTATSITSSDQTPAVHMGVDDFAQSTITISKGSKLRLVDDGPYVHVLFNGMWQNNKIHIATEPGAPTVNRLIVKGNSVEIGPFNAAGTFHIICVVHPGMNLMVVVH
jgi:plastocyanin